MPTDTDQNHRRGRPARLLVVALVFLLVATACSSDASDPETGPDPTSGPGTSAGIEGDPVETVRSGPLTLRLSNGQAEVDDATGASVVTGEPLSEAAVEAIFARLPEWVDAEADRTDFNRPAESLPPPTAGETIDNTFPVDATDPGGLDIVIGPLEVVRFQPEGEVGLAPALSITFNQPMVPVGTLEQFDDIDVPVQISPELPGRWQWIGTRTLRFEHDPEVFDRLPMATDFTVTVPAGTTSATGGELADAVAFDFSTPPAQVQSVWPSENESLPLDPAFLATFDQLVDADDVLAEVTLVAGNTTVQVRELTAAEIDTDDALRRRVDNLVDGRWIAFTPANPLPTDTGVSLTFPAGIPSAEGPLLSTESTRFAYRTYAPLRVTDTECGYDGCRPFDQFRIEFNNALDLEAFDPTTITVDPAIPGMVVNGFGQGIVVRGATAGQTTYEVTVPAGLTDEFGQTLGEDETIRFSVGDAEPTFGGFDRELTTLDPSVDDPNVSVWSINHEQVRVQIFEVEPSDWPAYREWERTRYDGGNELIDPPFEQIVNTFVRTDARADELTETVIDLSEALEDGGRHFVVIARPDPDYDPDDDLYWRNRPVVTWVQSTAIGVDAFSDDEQLVVWTTDLATGELLSDVEITLDGGPSGTTDATGLATLTLPVSVTRNDAEWLTATLGDDTALLPHRGWSSAVRQDQLRWYVIDDRAIYRPGETVSMKGWVRRLTLSDDAQLELLGTDTSVRYTVFDPQGAEIDTGTVTVNALGGFDLEVDLPEGANLGWGEINFTMVNGGVGSETSHRFQVQEFRRPEFEVAARNESEGPYVKGEAATVAVQAEYFAGGPLPDADVEWRVTTNEASYSPPNWQDFTFGVWTPWWYGFAEDYYYEDDGYYGGGYAPGQDALRDETFSARTDSTGTHYLQIDSEGDDTDQPVTVSAAATVFDLNRQAWSAATSLLVHPADNYVGLRSDRTFVEQGDPLDIEVILSDIDGNAVTGQELTVQAVRRTDQLVNGRWTEVDVDAQTCTVTTAATPASCSFATEVGGRYAITAIATDTTGREQRTELTRWVSGAEQRADRSVERQELTVVPDREAYAPGDVAEILVEAPFDVTEGLLTISRNGIEATETVSFEGSSAVVSIEIADRHIPGLSIQVDAVGTAARTDDDGEPNPDLPTRPAYGSARLDLSVPPTSRTLTVTATPADEVTQPGDDTSVDVEVLDASGDPVAGAELTVIVVDEAVLALSGYTLADPIDSFYGPLRGNVGTVYGRSSIVLSNPLDLLSGDESIPASGGDDAMAEGESADFAAEAPTAGRAAESSGQPGTPIDVRSNFDALATFAPEVTTDADGQATVELTLPDNLTRYRIMVVAANGTDEFGSGESNLTARLPLQVRPSAPRFANFGDAFELPVLVQNLGDTDLDVEVALQTSNLTVVDVPGQRVTVPAGDRVEVRFPVAADQAGTARFRVAAVSGDLSDAATISLPVYTPATTEAFATYGVIDDGTVAQPILTPEGVVPQFGGLEVTTSSTAVQALTDAVLYVNEYPYESADARAGRILTIVALRDVLEAFDAEGLPAPAALEAAVQDDIDTLVSLQNDDGGFPYWQRWRESRPFLSVHVTHALVEARDAGYDVPEYAIEQALWYLRDIQSYLRQDYGESAWFTIRSYALHVRDLAGDTDLAQAEELWAEAGDGDRLQLDAVAWLWPTLSDSRGEEIERLFANRVTETAGAATFTTDYGDDAWVILHSDRRTDGIVLDALIEQTPDSDLIPKVVAGLLGGQTQGRWDNLQENVFILLAVNQYFETFESTTPDFVARVWLGDLYAAEHTYEGRSVDANETIVPMDELLAPSGTGDLVLQKDGEGRLYYRIGLSYAPADLTLDPLDRGFVVQRTYEAVDDPSDVRLDDDGVWHIRAGAEVRVRVTMVADSRRTHVALVDPLPAGLEVLNPAVAVTADLPSDPSARASSWWYWTWFEHQNLRDDRAEAFTSWLWAGTHEYTYVARATTPGTFVVPPAKAEERFAPETFGRSGSDTVIVEDAGTAAETEAG